MAHRTGFEPNELSRGLSATEGRRRYADDAGQLDGLGATDNEREIPAVVFVAQVVEQTGERRADENGRHELETVPHAIDIHPKPGIGVAEKIIEFDLQALVAKYIRDGSNPLRFPWRFLRVPLVCGLGMARCAAWCVQRVCAGAG